MALTTDRQKCAHLLRRFGLGASEAELDFYLSKGGIDGAIDTLLNYEGTPEGWDLDVEAMANKNNNNVNPQAVGVWWVGRMLVTARPLQEKMTLFWHDHFATSGSKVTNGRVMHGQNEVLRANATGNFRTLLREVSKDPAMLLWLDNQYNVKGKPNENFAREIMELFTLGIGNYTEKDIQEGARAFTGWSIGRGPQGRPIGDNAKIPRGSLGFQFRPTLHDSGSKSFLGKTGNFDGDDIIDILCDNPRTAFYITHKLWEWFVYPEPDEKVIQPVADKFHKSNMNIKLLLRTVMKHPEFYSARAERKIFKCPVDFSIAILRQLGIGQMVAQRLAAGGDNVGQQLGPAFLAKQKMKSMGMDLLFPPDVAGWDSGANWVTSATMVERINYANIVFGTGARNVRYPAASLIGDASPEQAVGKLLSIFDLELPMNKVNILVDAARQAQSKAKGDSAAAMAQAIARLIFATPEFQFC
jgi:uncharacterized protein (DUF1800 family)